MALLLDIEGVATEIRPENGEYFSLRELQDAVGGYIEIIRLNEESMMVLNEEGKLMNLPVNEEATNIARTACAIRQKDFIVGDVVICECEEIV